VNQILPLHRLESYQRHSLTTPPKLCESFVPSFSILPQVLSSFLLLPEDKTELPSSHREISVRLTSRSSSSSIRGMLPLIFQQFRPTSRFALLLLLIPFCLYFTHSAFLNSKLDELEHSIIYHKFPIHPASSYTFPRNSFSLSSSSSFSTSSTILMPSTPSLINAKATYSSSYSSSLNSTSTAHVAMVSESSDRQVLKSIRMLLRFRRTALHIHLISPTSKHSYFNASIAAWDISSSYFKVILMASLPLLPSSSPSPSPSPSLLLFFFLSFSSLLFLASCSLLLLSF
jgi:hypothetical protein